MILLQTLPPEFSIIPQIGTAIGLIAFIVAIVFYYLRSQSGNDLEKIKSVKEDERANLMRDLADKYNIPTNGISPDQQYALLKDKLELDYRKRNQMFKFLSFVTLLVAILIALLIFSNNKIVPPPMPLKAVFENISNGDTIKVSNPDIKGKIIGTIPSNLTFYSVLKITNQYNLISKIDIDKENKFDFVSNIGATGELKIGIIACDEIVTKNIDTQMSKGNFKLLSLTNGADLIGAVDVYKKKQ